MSNFKKTVIAVLLTGCMAFNSVAYAESIEVAFSPREGAEALVVKVIDSAKNSIRLAAYSFTSAPVVKALIAAKKRGVDVGVIVDYKQNVQMDNGAGRAALNLLVKNGIPTRVISAYPIHHDKYIIADGLNVETGSFNYSKAAEWGNSENVIVVWGNAELAAKYIEHWQDRYKGGTNYEANY